MAEMTQCPGCASWNAPQATRCRTCGTELRGPQISFDGPPADAPRLRSPEEARAEEERKAAGIAESMKAQRELKRQEDRKRREYLQRKEQLQKEIRQGHAPESEPGVDRVTAAIPAKEPLDFREPSGPTPSPSMPLSRIPTHVEGLDRALGGGLPAGFVVVIGGAPGTMKSSLAFQIVAANARAGRRGLYLSCEQSTGGLLRQMSGLGIDLEGVSDQLKIIDALQLRGLLRGAEADWLAPLQALVAEAQKAGGLELLVIDSLDGIDALAAFEPRRRELFRLFEWLRDLGVTTFVIGERPDYMVQGTILQPRYDEDFLADGVLNLRLHPISDLDVQRRLRIVKMRGTRHETGYLALHVSEGEFAVGRVLST